MSTTSPDRPLARDPVDDRQHRAAIAARHHRQARHGAGRGVRPRGGQGRRRRRRTVGLAGADRGAGDQRHRRAARAATRRVLLQPVMAQRRRIGAPAGIRRQRVLPARPGSPAASRPRRTATHRGRLQAGQLDDLRQRRTPRDDEHGRHGAQRRPASASTRSGSPSRWTARPTNRRKPRRRWVSRRTPTRRGWRRTCGGKARSSPSRPR